MLILVFYDFQVNFLVTTVPVVTSSPTLRVVYHATQSVGERVSTRSVDTRDKC
jgi:hypothetical protein